MQQLNTISLSQFTDLVDRNWSIHNDFIQTGIARQMFIYSDETANTGDIRRFTEIDVEDFAKRKPQGSPAAKAGVQYGYEKDCQASRFAREITITWEMRRYNKKPEVVAQLTSLSHFCPNRIELDLTHRITFATSTTYTDQDGFVNDITGGDSLPVAYNLHTLTGSSQTWSNIVPGNPQFSAGALELAENLAVTDILSNLGNRRTKNFNVIFTTDDPNLCNAVKKTLKSTSDVNQNNPSVVNVYQDKYTHIKLPYLATNALGARDATKAHWWGIAAVNQGVRGFQAYFAVWENPNLKTPAPGNNGENVHTDDWTYGTRCSYGIATVSGKGLILSPAA